MKCLSSCTDVLHRPLILNISRCCFAEDGKEMYQHVIKTHVQSVQSDCFCSLNQLFCGVLVAVAVVLA